MSTSGIYTFTTSEYQIMREAMLNIGQLYEGETMTATEVVDLRRKLNMMVKQWQAKADFAPGLKVWTRLRGELYLSNTTGEYILGPGTSGGWGTTHNQTVTTATAIAGATTISVPSGTVITAGDNVGVVLDSGVIFWTEGGVTGTTLSLLQPLPTQASSGTYVFNYTTTQIRPERIETAVLRDVNFNDIPLNVMNLEDYELLPTKASDNYPSDPQAIYYEYRLDNTDSGILYTDSGAAVDTTKHIHMVFLSPIQSFTGAADEPQYPQGWYDALSWGLAKKIAPMFNKPWTEAQQSNYIESMAMAREQFPDTTTMYFEPGRDDDARGPYM